MTRAEIVEAFERRERAAGGWHKADQKAVLRETAEELGISYEDAREAMLDEWTRGHSG